MTRIFPQQYLALSRRSRHTQLPKQQELQVLFRVAALADHLEHKEGSSPTCYLFGTSRVSRKRKVRTILTPTKLRRSAMQGVVSVEETVAKLEVKVSGFVP
mmetsp:Transcript_8200/g.20114  ORF Transcript_8200/g.20114 Transcript_8200/m.20114 type:complete len:101 (-) Transcript_8200:142-444(-)